jgi:asparagine synthase (glutamine-hydrolysing)
MCGIWALIGKPYSRKNAQILLSNLAGRGPEGTRIMEHNSFQLGFTRLAINGLSNSGMQPMFNEDLVWICNGEIYNYRDLASRYSIELDGGSDCSVIGPLFQKMIGEVGPNAFFQSLDGVFAMVIADHKNDVVYVARDPYGVRPLYVGKSASNIQFSSELKALNFADCSDISHFPPGHYAMYNMKTLECLVIRAYHTIPWLKNPEYEDSANCASALASSLRAAVKKRMMMERPVAALLSGGLDSSLIAALVQKELVEAGKPPLKTFSIGFEGSEDLKFARIVADYIKSDHTEVVMTPEKFFDAVPEVIRAIESYDITTVRASVGNYLVCREIAWNSDCKVVFNGDGSDEVFGGYMYFFNAPSDEAFEAETTRLLEDIHKFDVLRSDRSISSHGLEPRTPFLDKQFVSVAKSISTKLRRPVKHHWNEKQILRFAFFDTNLLPYSVLTRKKEAFSDGVSGIKKSWYEECQERALEIVGPDWKHRATFFDHLTPQTAEAYYYRTIFYELYARAEKCAVPYHWMPRWAPGATDPSARTLSL